MVQSCSNANIPKIGMFAVTPWDVVRGRPETRRQAAREKNERHPVQLVISLYKISCLLFLPPFHFPHSERMQRQHRISGTLKGLGKKKFPFRTLWERKGWGLHMEYSLVLKIWQYLIFLLEFWILPELQKSIWMFQLNSDRMCLEVTFLVVMASRPI